MEKTLPPIPAKRYFTIGEVAELCGVKPHVLRYWEQEFTQLRPMKRRGNRRYYQHHEVLMIRRIRDLLYDQGFTISGARNRLQEIAQSDRHPSDPDSDHSMVPHGIFAPTEPPPQASQTESSGEKFDRTNKGSASLVHDVRRELLEIRELLTSRL